MHTIMLIFVILIRFAFSFLIMHLVTMMLTLIHDCEHSLLGGSPRDLLYTFPLEKDMH